MLSLVPGGEKEYLSYDTISKSADTVGDADLLYPVEFLDSINLNNFTQHRLMLKKGVPIMLLRNLSQTEGPCNGTRLIVTNLADLVIEAAYIPPLFLLLLADGSL
uniref:DNA helicase Pif1-like 2B domain-containing protein n=1 Tax=Arundo donax TaxID=35708 RepID=A0A0A9HNR3_ARUDO